TWALTTPPNYVGSAGLTVLIGLILVVMSYMFGVYQRIWERTSGHGITVIVNAVTAATIIIAPIILLLQQKPLSLPIVLLGNLLTLCGFIGVRYRSRLASSFIWRWNAVIRREFPAQRTRVLIIGAGESGQALAWRLMHRFNQNHGRHQVVGFIDDDLDKQNMYVEGCRVIGTRKDIERIVEEMNVDLIVVAVHNISGPDFREILTSCENTKALIKVVPDLEALVNAKHSQALLRDVQAEDLIGRSMVTRHEAVDLTPVTNKVILITGAAGSIGWELSRQIMQYNPSKAILLDNNESGLHDLTIELRTKYPEVELVPALADITIRSTIRAVYEKYHPQIVFHAAAYKHVPMLEYYPREAIRVNIGGTRTIASLAQEFGVERFVLISSDKAVNPSNIMGATKRACELMLHALSENKANRTRFAAVRFGNVLGSRGSVVPTFNRQIDSGGPVTVTDEEMTRYFMSIPEAVNLIIHAACLTKGSDIYVLSMGEVVRIVELAERMIRLRGLRPYKDIEIKFTGIRPGEKLHEELFHGDEKPFETIHPNITQVDTWNDLFNWQEFREKLERLEKDLPENHTNVLGKLLQIIMPQPERIAEVQPTNTSVRVG
ncbi:MAG: nucleoside-diphosphate sugar epimerase/dehydratase, partial [Chloroflexota bacterium]